MSENIPATVPFPTQSFWLCIGSAKTEGPSALSVLRIAIDLCIEQLQVKEDPISLQYDLACLLLGEINCTYEGRESLARHISLADQRIPAWTRENLARNEKKIVPESPVQVVTEADLLAAQNIETELTNQKLPSSVQADRVSEISKSAKLLQLQEELEKYKGPKLPVENRCPNCNADLVIFKYCTCPIPENQKPSISVPGIPDSDPDVN